jgi:hypothetical protein
MRNFKITNMKNFKKNVLAVCTLLLVFGCKKNSEENTVDSKLENKVIEWINKQQGSNDVKRTAIANEIKLNLEIDKSWLNSYEKGETILTIPIKSSCKLTNNKDKNPTNYLVLFQDINNKIRSGYIWQALPGATITKNTIANIYNHKEEDLDGTYALLGLHDTYIQESTYEKNHLKKLDLPISKSITNTRTNTTCYDWYLITTTYDENGNVVSQSESYLTTTCYGVTLSGVNPVETISTIANDGSGGGSVITSVFKTVDWLVEQNPSGAWAVRSAESLTGEKNAYDPTQQGGHFTGINHIVDYVNSVDGCLNPDPSPNTPTYLPWANWHKYSISTGLYGMVSAISTVSGKLTICNNNAPDVYVSKSKTFSFKIEFP